MSHQLVLSLTELNAADSIPGLNVCDSVWPVLFCSLSKQKWAVFLQGTTFLWIYTSMIRVVKGVS